MDSVVWKLPGDAVAATSQLQSELQNFGSKFRVWASDSEPLIEGEWSLEEPMNSVCCFCRVEGFTITLLVLQRLKPNGQEARPKWRAHLASIWH